MVSQILIRWIMRWIVIHDPVDSAIQRLCNCLVLSLFVFCGKSNKVTKLQQPEPGL